MSQPIHGMIISYEVTVDEIHNTINFNGETDQIYLGKVLTSSTTNKTKLY